MSYKLIDNIIKKWGSDNKLTLFTDYQGEEVRSMEIVFKNGKRYQLWIDFPKDGNVVVHLWDYKSKKWSWEISIEHLYGLLSHVLDTCQRCEMPTWE